MKGVQGSEERLSGSHDEWRPSANSVHSLVRLKCGVIGHVATLTAGPEWQWGVVGPTSIAE